MIKLKKSINELIQPLLIDGLELENQLNPKNNVIEEWFIGRKKLYQKKLNLKLIYPSI